LDVEVGVNEDLNSQASFSPAFYSSNIYKPQARFYLKNNGLQNTENRSNYLTPDQLVGSSYQSRIGELERRKLAEEELKRERKKLEKERKKELYQKAALRRNWIENEIGIYDDEQPEEKVFVMSTGFYESRRRRSDKQSLVQYKHTTTSGNSSYTNNKNNTEENRYTHTHLNDEKILDLVMQSYLEQSAQDQREGRRSTFEVIHFNTNEPISLSYFSF
jgi:hypothetical protein